MNQFDSSGLLLEALDHNLPFRDPGIVTQISTLSQLPPKGAFDGSSISLPDLFKSRGDPELFSEGAGCGGSGEESCSDTAKELMDQEPKGAPPCKLGFW